MVKFHADLTLEKFWIDWFGPLGRELGTNKFPHRNWTDNPNDLLDFAKMCASEHEKGEYCRPCWISAQPFRFIKTIEKHGYKRHVGQACAIEKLFYDFDDDTKYCKKCKKYIKKNDFRPVKDKKGSFCPKCGTECFEKPRKDIVGKEVKQFIQNIKEHEVLIVETRKGYHVYIFLTQIFEFRRRDYTFAKEVYKLLMEQFITKEYEFMDERVIGDLMRFARVPLTAHEKTGAVCQIVDHNLKPTKVRSLDFYRTYGIRESTIENAITTVTQRRHKAIQRAEDAMKEIEESYGKNGHYLAGKIRPCFQVRMDLGEMSHAQRLAWLSEIYYAGYNTQEKMLELCRRTWKDFREQISSQQIEDFFRHERWVYKPYRCSTIKQKGWCLKDSKQCPFYKSNRKANK